MDPASEANITSRINSAYNALFYNKGGLSVPYICITCDSFCPRDFKWITWKTLEKKKSLFSTQLASDKIRREYTAKWRHEAFTDNQWLDEALLSPRCESYDRKRVSICSGCFYAQSKGQTPQKAIRNGFYFGETPKELQELSDVELAFITPVRTFGYCFSFTGGKNTALKGTLGYFKVEQKSIVRGAGIALKACDILNKHIIFVLYGEMTESQINSAKKKAHIRPTKVAEAIKWLKANNKLWQNVDISDLDISIQSIQAMTYDLSQAPTGDLSIQETAEEAFARATNENSESFSVYFPDSTMTEVNGGTESQREFERIVLSAKQSGYDATIVADLNRTFTTDYEDDNFIMSCPLQFPYGICGPDTTRFLPNGDYYNMTLSDFATHLSNLSNPNMHVPKFVLKVFNMKLRSTMLQRAFTTFNSKRTIHNLREDLSLESFQDATISNNYGNRASSDFLKSLQTINRSMPHTDSAAKRARCYMDALQYKFGLGGIFLTVTPDDETSFLVSAYSMQDKNGEPIRPSELNYEQLRNAEKKRKSTRISFPGITALTFELLCSIVIEEVIGWDTTNNCASKPGLFGTPLAFGGAIEEQGRQSLHVHFVLWIKDLKETTKQAACGIKKEEEKAEIALRQLVHQSISTKLLHTSNDNQRRLFEHQCCAPQKKRRKLICASKQQLRDMRHKHCSKEKDNLKLAECPECGTKWTSEELVLLALKNTESAPRVTSLPDKSGFLNQCCFEYTKPAHAQEDVNPLILHTKADLHRSCHVTSCFKRHDKKRAYKVAFPDECRMRLPDESKPTAEVSPLQINDTGEADAYNWSGKKSRRRYLEVHPRRGDFDNFVNTYVPAISHSKIGGNTNARIITPGPLGFYTIKYPTKSTQEQNSDPYKEVLSALTRLFNRERKHSDDRAESLRLLIASAFAHNKENIIGSSQASYLTRNNSRFVWSHNFVYLPHRDLKSVLTKNEVNNFNIKSFKGTPYADVGALNYLCRPSELEDLSPREFFEQYEVIKRAHRRKDQVMHFQDTEHFAHPTSGLDEQHANIQVVRPRHTNSVFWIPAYTFSDTAMHQGKDLLTCLDHEISHDMEEHALNILLLMAPYRCLQDLRVSGSFVYKLRQLVRNGTINHEAQDILNNIQDATANFLRVRRTEDPLQKHTVPFKTKESQNHDEDLPRQTQHLEGNDLDNFLELAEDAYFNDRKEPVIGRNQYTQDFIPHRLNVEHHLTKDTSDNPSAICSMTRDHRNRCVRTFVQTSEQVHQVPQTHVDPDNRNYTSPTPRDIINMMWTRKGLGALRSLAYLSSGVNLHNANGSAESIRHWSSNTGLDAHQAKAFECISSAFVLSFYRSAENLPLEDTRPHHFLREKLKLCKLSNKLPLSASMTTMGRPSFKNTPSRIFLHGPGGSGKSAVISLLLEYAEEFCDYLEVPFTRNTIQVTAMSGVAATLIGGQTTHKALHFRKSITQEAKEAWEQTRMLIVDEVSFASQNEIKLINSRSKLLKDSQQMFGGLDVLFLGDMHQLEPVKPRSKKIYEESFPEFHGSLTTYISLEGRHRFKDDPEWGQILAAIREGRANLTHIRRINEQATHKGGTIPNDLAYATATNQKRASFNTAVFLKYLEEDGTRDAVAIIASDIYKQTGARTFEKADNAWTSFLINSCSEADVSPLPYQGRLDPVLLLHYNKPIMVTKNISVTSGLANGTKAKIHRIITKPGTRHQTTSVRHFRIRAYRACDIQEIHLIHENTNITPRLFKLQPEEQQFQVSIPYPKNLQPGGNPKKQTIKLKALQLPIIINNATTGHKLQGATVPNLFVAETSNRHQNWLYVVLSRVKTMHGLKLQYPLDEALLDKLNKKPSQLIEMLKQMDSDIGVKPITDNEYSNFIGDQN